MRNLKKLAAALALSATVLSVNPAFAGPNTQITHTGSCGWSNPGEVYYLENYSNYTVRVTLTINQNYQYWATWNITVSPHTTQPIGLCTIADMKVMDVYITNEQIV